MAIGRSIHNRSENVLVGRALPHPTPYRNATEGAGAAVVFSDEAVAATLVIVTIVAPALAE